MINEQYDRAKALLETHKEGHAQLAQLLVEKEVIFAEDVERIFGKRPWVSRTEELLSLNENQEEQQKQLPETPQSTSENPTSQNESDGTATTPESHQKEDTEPKL